MFKKNDYIVVLSGPPCESFPSGFVYKQQKDSIYLNVAIDAEGDPNAWGLCSFKPGKVELISVQWRYATEHEQLLYDALNRPVSIDADMYDEMRKDSKHIFQLPRL